MSNRVNRVQAAVQRNVLSEKLPSLPNFLQKLWVILTENEFAHTIAWNDAGDSFHIVDPQSFCQQVLPNFFKHNNLNSFVRQLNLYGFRKVSSVNKNSFVESSDNLHFAHQYFIRGRYNLLQKIKRNAATNKQKVTGDGQKCQTTSGKNVILPEEDLIGLLQELKIVRERQSTMKNTITQLTRDNILLWQEMAALRNSYLKQKENVGKLVQFLMGLGQPHQQKRMPHNQRIVQLEEIDSNGGSVQLNFNSNHPQANNSNALAIQQQNSARFGALDCDILDGIQQELSETVPQQSTLSLDVETALLEGLQLRQRAIEEGAPYLDSGLLSCEDQYQAVDRPMRLRNEQRLQYYENAGGIQLKRPFQRQVLSPGSSNDFYPKRALYSNNQNQELVPAGSSTRGRLPIRHSLNDHSVAGRSNLQMNSSNLVISNNSSPDQEEDGEVEGVDMQYYLDGHEGRQQMQYDEEYEDLGEEDLGEWQPEYFDDNNGDLMFMNEEELAEHDQDHEQNEMQPVELPTKK